MIPPPPLSFPAPCPSPGGGDLVDPKRAKPPPKGAVQSIVVESGEHVQEFKVKWSRTKKFYTSRVKEQIAPHRQPIERAHDFHIVALLAFICHCDKLCTPTFLMRCYFVFCRNFCAPQCACTAVLRSPGGWWGTVTW